jgi:hypothetical protein
MGGDFERVGEAPKLFGIRPPVNLGRRERPERPLSKKTTDRRALGL